MHENSPLRRKVVYTYGAFDLLHPAHVMLLEKARAMGCHLVVGVLSDDAIKCRKGKDRPVQPQKDRAFIVKALRCVDEVVMQDTYDPVPAMKKYNIGILTKGDDWDDCEISAKQYGCEFKKLHYNNDYSTSSIVKKIKNDSNK